ncbi:S66 peptidase family protein [Tepidimicrobium xylanilyticum]|uniref:Muramoyltetrapeptide carboxypeptidase n=1 Tax=Tepidimicrobium xylanilyticum TaxID=1123352 RepID=A0A1H2RND6_9FIRM|nr:LD-carboxypeptidase [Tepidimicrobium xylanilyticum]SDW20274.1 muramoyltetrapeptide carboxypeptidase [Tepidimicrobium xylanilyticum]
MGNKGFDLAAMIKPKGLKLGATLGVVAPASPTTKEKLELAYKKLKQLGFNVVMGESCYENYGYLAGSDELRARDLNNMFKNEKIHGIICLRGGYGTPRILDLLDYEMIRRNPKVFIGYSDITALHIAFNQLSNLITFHGPMAASDMVEGFGDFSRESLLNSILDGDFQPNIVNPTKDIKTLNGGVAEGRIIGGNLSLIAATIGTPYEIDTRGKILLIEEIGEEPYSVDRMLTQLMLSKKLEEVAGIILGDFKDCDTKSSEYDNTLNLEQVIDDIIKPLNKPTITNLEAGHCEPVITIPLGIRARLDADKKELILLERPIL